MSFWRSPVQYIKFTGLRLCPLPSQKPEGECTWCFANQNKVDPCRRDGLFWTNCYSIPQNNSPPVSLSLLLFCCIDLFPLPLPLCLVLSLSFLLPLDIESQKWIEIRPEAQTPLPTRKQYETHTFTAQHCETLSVPSPSVFPVFVMLVLVCFQQVCLFVDPLSKDAFQSNASCFH